MQLLKSKVAPGIRETSPFLVLISLLCEYCSRNSSQRQFVFSLQHRIHIAPRQQHQRQQELKNQQGARKATASLPPGGSHFFVYPQSDTQVRQYNSVRLAKGSETKVSL